MEAKISLIVDNFNLGGDEIHIHHTKHYRYNVLFQYK